MDIRPGDAHGCFRLFDGDDYIGEIRYHPPEEEGDDDWWEVELWSLTGSEKTWYADAAKSEAEARDDAAALYKEWQAERREANRGPRATVISSPMGGQPRSPKRR